jgi:glutathione S-transferase
MRLYEHLASGNCLKCRIALRQLERPYESVTVDPFRGETRSDELKQAGRDRTMPEVFAYRLERARDALAALERGLADPREHERIAGWLDRVEATPRFVNDLEPVPDHVSARPL